MNSLLLWGFLLVLCPLLQGKLLLVMEFFRHGAREPLNDYWNADEFPNWGELTSVGMRQHYNLGTFLREIYISKRHFLKKAYDPNEIYVRSSDYNRTIQSVEAQLYGLYPLGTGPRIPLNLDPMLENPPFIRSFLKSKHHKNALPRSFQPVPIHTFPRPEDNLLLSTESNCSIIQVYAQRVKNSSYYQNLTERFRNATIEVGRLINLTDEEIQSLTIREVTRIYDVFICDVFADKPLPENLSESLWMNLTMLSSIYKIFKTSADPEMIRFYSTPIFEEIITSFENKINRTDGDLKWRMYSAHDTTLSVMLSALNLTTYQCIDEMFLTGNSSRENCFIAPEFAASLLIELHENTTTGENYVKIRYNGHFVRLCNGSKKCPWSEFKEMMRNFMVDYDSLCNSEQIQPSSTESLKSRNHLRRWVP